MTNMTSTLLTSSWLYNKNIHSQWYSLNSPKLVDIQEAKTLNLKLWVMRRNDTTETLFWMWLQEGTWVQKFTQQGRHQLWTGSDDWETKRLASQKKHPPSYLPLSLSVPPSLPVLCITEHQKAKIAASHNDQSINIQNFNPEFRAKFCEHSNDTCRWWSHVCDNPRNHNHLPSLSFPPLSPIIPFLSPLNRK